jgi:cytochrome P450
LRDFRLRPIGLFQEATQAHGDIVRFRFLHNTAHLIRHPDMIEHVLLTHQRNYTKQTPGIQKLQAILGQGLLTSDGDFWRRQRRIAQPAFHRKRIAGFFAGMVSSTHRMLARWNAQGDAPLDISEEMMAVTFDAAGESLFSADVGESAQRISDALSTAMRINTDRAWRAIRAPRWLPTAENRTFDAAMETLDTLVHSLIQSRRAAPGGHDDLLAMLVEARDDETGEGMTDVQLRDEVLTLLMAGHETTANALTWTFHLVGTHPEVEERLLAEVDSVLGDRDPCLEDLPQMPWLNAVSQEAMRLYPPGWLFGRMPIEDDEIGGFHIPGQTLVMMSAFITHRHPDFWPDPERFDPERFLPEPGAKRHRFAHFPFGAGTRQCIGAAFASMEMSVILAMAAQRYRLRMVPGFTPEVEPLVTLRARDGMPMQLQRRAGT